MERGVTGRTPAGSHPARSNCFTKKGLSGREGVLSVDWKREVIGSFCYSFWLSFKHPCFQSFLLFEFFKSFSAECIRVDYFNSVG